MSEVADPECRGCASLWHTERRTECSYTFSNVKSIPNCLCKSCLLKITCHELCEKFITVASTYIDKDVNGEVVHTIKILQHINSLVDERYG